MVPPRGIEPRTLRLQGGRSTGLSYNGVVGRFCSAHLRATAFVRPFRRSSGLARRTTSLGYASPQHPHNSTNRRSVKRGDGCFSWGNVGYLGMEKELLAEACARCYFDQFGPENDVWLDMSEAGRKHWRRLGSFMEALIEAGGSVKLADFGAVCASPDKAPVIIRWDGTAEPLSFVSAEDGP